MTDRTIKAPCLECTRRHEGCHATCGYYERYRKNRDEEREAISKAMHNEADDFRIEIRRKVKEKKRMDYKERH